MTWRLAPFGWFVALVALVALVGLGGCGVQPTLRGAVREPPLEVADVRLPDASNGGAPMAMVAPAGELLLVYFGYTSCPDVCPTTMSDLSVAIADLPEASASRVSVAMVTVDPEHDTGERLAGYLSYFFDRSHALRTDDPEELDAVTAAFGVQFEVEDHAPGDAYGVAHTAITYVVDDTGTVLVEWPFGFGTDAMASDLSLLLGRQT